MAHTYIPTNWVNRQTQLNADNMNKIEQELARLARESGGIREVLEGPGVQVTPGIDDTSIIVGLKSGSSKDNLLVLDKDNGLILTLSLGYDPLNRKLVLSSGSGWKTEVDFGVDRSIVDGNFDPETRNIVFTMSDDTEVVVDMSNMKINWKFINSRSIVVTEGYNADEGVSTFSLECQISEEEGNNLSIKDDGLYSERNDWRYLGVSGESDGYWEFNGIKGSKHWFFESSKTVFIDEYISPGKKGEVRYYNFGYKLSTLDGNSLEVRNGKLYVSDEIPEEAAMRLEVERLEEEVMAEKAVRYRTSDSIDFIDKIDRFSGKRYVEASLRISSSMGNELEVTSDGVYVPPYKPGPGKPDLTPYVTEVEEFESEMPKIFREVNFIKNNEIIK